MRYGVVPVGIFFILLIVTVFLLPILVNVQKFVPEIEKQLSQATGRSFAFGPDLAVSFFPWLSISFSDMKIGNPPGFLSDDFVQVRTFEARIKVLPLLRKQIQISRFVVGGLSVNLEKNGSGQANWEFGRDKASGTSSETAPWPFSLFSENLSFALLAVTDGHITWSDKTQNIQHEIADIMLLLNDFTPNHPVSVDCRATFNGKPVAVEGKVGPLIKEHSQGALPVDIVLSVVNKFRGQIHGRINSQEKASSFELSFHLAPFSPRDFFSAGFSFPLIFNDSKSFEIVDMEFLVRGGGGKIAIEKGIARLDDTKLNFSLLAQNFKSPQIDFTFDLDRLDVDRYMVPPATDGKYIENDSGPKEPADGAGPAFRWGDAALAGIIKVGELKMHGVTMAEVHLPLHGKEGIFTSIPATFKTSQGQVEAALTLDLRDTEPTMQANLKAQELQTEVLLRDLVGWDFLRGILSGELALQFAGDSLEKMKKNLNGEASILIRDGALIGEHRWLPQRSENQYSPAAVAASGEQTRTDFINAKSVLTINNGLVNIRETSLSSPAYSLQLTGTADISRQLLNLQMESSFVTTTVGKCGREEKVDHSFRYVISGPFSEPEFKQTAMANGSSGGGRTNVKQLVAQKLPSPADDDVKNLIGKDLVDPAVVAQRFRLQPETLRQKEVKKKYPVGTGKVHIGTLQEETTLQ